MTYKQCLEKSGLKNTKQRKLVYDVLTEFDVPISAEDLYDALRDESINLSTIYRILEIFEAKDIVKKTTIYADNKATYEIKKDIHRHHLVCVNCKKITPISGCPLHAYEETLSAEKHYIILDHQLEISGICPECQKKV